MRTQRETDIATEVGMRTALVLREERNKAMAMVDNADERAMQTIYKKIRREVVIAERIRADKRIAEVVKHCEEIVKKQRASSKMQRYMLEIVWVLVICFIFMISDGQHASLGLNGKTPQNRTPVVYRISENGVLNHNLLDDFSGKDVDLLIPVGFADTSRLIELESTILNRNVRTIKKVISRYSE